MTLFAIILGAAVFCGGPNPAAGAPYFIQPSQAIIISDQMCETLSGLKTKRSWKFYEHETWLAIDTLFLLGHEEGHAHDPRMAVFDPEFLMTCSQVGSCEAFADCYGAGRIEILARTLGVSAYNARRFRRLAYRYERSHLGYAPTSDECWEK